MTRSRSNVRGSQPGSPERSSEEEDSDTKSPKEEKMPSRGRVGQRADGEGVDAMDTVD